MLAMEVVSPGSEKIARDYTEKAIEYQNTGKGLSLLDPWAFDSES